MGIDLRIWTLGFVLTIGACSDGEEIVSPVKVISATVNGALIKNGDTNIAIDFSLEIVFDTSLDTDVVSQYLHFTTSDQTVVYDLTFANATSKLIVTADLVYNTTYELVMAVGPIGLAGEVLETPLSLAFTTAEDEVIRSMAPCTNTGSCLNTTELTTGDGTGSFTFYANYPIYEPNATWENLSQAIIVVHGLERNADDYYSYLNSTLEQEELQENTILIAPFFKNNGEAENDDLYWNGSAWREGQNSISNVKLSSFAVLDSLITQLANSELFPVLEEILITGHSSGGLFTQVYAIANRAENQNSALSFTYMPSNSQYYYYPNGFRYDEDIQVYTEPSSCALYDSWPLGYKSLPSYLDGVSLETFNGQLTDRTITYLLGNGTGSDGSLNTSDCKATLLGSTRFSRGENVFAHAQHYFSPANQTKEIVQGIGHDGQGMYQSSEFKAILSELFK
ncbi:hypothetical protein SAMN04488029_2633 [Reichenbachiella faecimaris]|uniref:SbsA Ig-like domain-containing protein n=1 Tax=Reichenbachiella faecimaris TaxID=692418 RepID=A0A1W2GH21_REIFA|nr:Ig-like domain-containing protein [Reichenbachiella faecimaris]SMD35965.1 hypothetical protein SAMN04488029_2633 [Reichenbachiella faecimaris]